MLVYPSSFLQGKLIIVFSAPFGLSLFFIFGGSFTFSRLKIKQKLAKSMFNNA